MQSNSALQQTLLIMNAHLYSPHWGEIMLNDLPPGPKNELILSGAEHKIATQNKDYCFLLQEFPTDDARLRLAAFQSGQKQTYTYVWEGALILRLAISGTQQFHITSLGNQVFHQCNYNFFNIPLCTANYTIGSNEIFTFLDVVMSVEYLKRFEKKYSLLEDFIKRSVRKAPAKLCMLNQVAPIEMLRWVDELIQYGNSTHTAIRPLEEIACNLVESALHFIRVNPPKRSIRLKQEDITAIYGIADLLASTTKPVTLEMLADIVKMPTSKLNKGFKEIYGHSVLNHRHEEKMRLALRLVDDKRYNGKQVADLLGYQSSQNFTRAFKNRFGYSPYKNSKD